MNYGATLSSRNYSPVSFICGATRPNAAQKKSKFFA